jgi:16S rRNA (guanine966-N2)-methyltransferase
MRVISGRYRGRRLKGPKGMGLRPTGDRLKEALFNILQPRIPGAVMLDAFSGTGAIGIEALSRGAGKVVFIDRDLPANRLIQQNLEICGIEADFLIVREDVFTALRSFARRGFKADIIFFDPPYDFKPYHDLLKIVFVQGLVSTDACVVIEHNSHAVLPESDEGFERIRVVRQGDKCLSIYRTQEAKTGIEVSCEED